MTRAAVLVGLIAVVAACSDPPPSLGPRDVSRVETKEYPLSPSGLVDVLFVIDGSPAMAGVQATLATDMPRLVDVLQMEAPDLQIGVTTTDGSGVLAGAGCPGLALGARWIRSAQRGGTTIRNYTGELRDVFACMAGVGTTGPAVRQPLESMRRAITDNVGFVRFDALLLVVIVSNGDDCSLRAGARLPADPFACTEEALACDEPDLRAPGEKHACTARTGAPDLRDVDEYVQFIDALKAPYLADVAAIVGPETPVVVGDGPALAPSCTSTSTGVSALPAVRTQAFTHAFTGRSLAVSLCDDDLGDALDHFGFPDPGDLACLDGQLVDLDPATDGIQPDCAVTLVSSGGDPQDVGQVVPQCDSLHYTTPCWALGKDVQCQAETTHSRITFQFGDTPIPRGLLAHIECAIE